MQAAIYARVSTSNNTQHTENQIPELLQFCQRNGWEVIEYIENASAKAGSRRPVLNQLMEDAAAGRFGVVVVTRIDRFGRSLIDFLQNILKLNEVNVRFVATSQMIDTDKRSPMATMFMQILAIFAEFERALIVERVNEGVKEYARSFAAGAVGKGANARHSKSGKDLPHGRPRKVFHRARAAEMHAAGMSWREIGVKLGVPFSTVRAACKEASGQ